MIPPPPGVLNEALQAILRGTRESARPTTQDVYMAANSPLVADTLAKIVGHYNLPNSIFPSGSLSNGVYGVTDPRYSEIAINTNKNANNWGSGTGTPASDRNLEATLLHEIGHVSPQKMEEQFPTYSSVARPNLFFPPNNFYDRPPIVYRSEPGKPASSLGEMLKLFSGMSMTLPGGAKKTSDAEKKAFAALDSYYSGNNGKVTTRTDLNEPFGESFAQAFTNAMQYVRENSPKLQKDYRERAGKLEGNTPGMGQLVSDILSHKMFDGHPLQKVYNVPKRKEKKK